MVMRMLAKGAEPEVRQNMADAYCTWPHALWPTRAMAALRVWHSNGLGVERTVGQAVVVA